VLEVDSPSLYAASWYCNGLATFLFLFSGSVYGDDLQDGMGANEREVFRSIIFSAEIVIS
jgi:hypothetical protein